MRINMTNVFTHREDFMFFDRLFTEMGGIAQNTHLFDFRDPAEKRKEFNRMRKQVFKSLVAIYGSTCQLNCHADCTGTASEVDYLIPLSSNVLNKKLRNIRGVNGNKTPTQSFGSNHQDNFVLACSRCNAFKKHRFPTQELIQEIIDIRNKIPTQVKLSHVERRVLWP
jgi:5-methylcytosine-specific restriction endonuclease McrA